MSVEDMRALGYRVVDRIVDRLAKLPDSSPARKASGVDLRARLIEAPASIDEVLEEVDRDILANCASVDHPRFFAFVPSPGNYVSAIADALASGFNIFAGTSLAGSGAIAAELALIEF